MKRFLFFVPLLWLMSCSNETDILKPEDSAGAYAGKMRPNTNQYLDQKAVFNIDNVPTITLEFSVAQWNKILTNFDLNPLNEKKVVASFKYEGNGGTILLDSIAVKLKGNTSRRRPEGDTGQLHNASNPDWHHCHFSLDFSKNRPNQRFSYLNKLDLKWFKDQADYTREIYCYDLFERNGVWTAPQASYCRLYIKVIGDAAPAYFGVYGMIEKVDEDYIKRRQFYWSGAIGDLWKGGWAGNLNANFVQTSSIGVEDVSINPNESLYYAYDLKTNEDFLPAAQANLIQFITDLNTKTGTEFHNWISTKMDVPLFMKTYATNVVLGMWDDYWVNANNFYFYFAGNGKAYFIPYDYDNTLGTSQIIANSGTQNPLTWGPQNNRPLITKIMAIPEYQTMYKNYITQLVSSSNNLFHVSKSIPRIQHWQNMIAPYVSNDTGEDMIINDVPASWGNQPNYRLLSGNIQGGASGPANWFSTRSNNIPW